MANKQTSKDVLKEILSQKILYSDSFLTIKYKKLNLIKSKFFLIVPLTVSKKAVIRNKLKRRSRAILKSSEVPSAVNLAVFFKKGSEKLKFEELKEKLSTAVKNIK